MDNQTTPSPENSSEPLPAQNPSIEEVEVPKKPPMKHWIIFAFFIVIVLSVGGFLIVNLYNKNKNLSDQQKTTTGSSQTTELYQVINPNTGDLYQDIKVRMKELLP